MSDGFIPGKCSPGNQCGNPNYLYLALTPESANWYACHKGNDGSVLEVSVPKNADYLKVDPEDGMYLYPEYNLEKELDVGNSVVLYKRLKGKYFKKYEGTLSITGCDD